MDPAKTIKVEPMARDDDSCSSSPQSPVAVKKELPDYSSDGNETSQSRDRVATSKRKYVASSSSSISSRRRKNKRRNTVRKSRHQGDGNAVLRVDKLAFGTTFEQLRSRFEPFGTVKDVSVHFYEKSSENYGLVTFSLQKDAIKALIYANGDANLRFYDGLSSPNKSSRYSTTSGGNSSSSSPSGSSRSRSADSSSSSSSSSSFNSRRIRVKKAKLQKQPLNSRRQTGANGRSDCYRSRSQSSNPSSSDSDHDYRCNSPIPSCSRSPSPLPSTSSAASPALFSLIHQVSDALQQQQEAKAEDTQPIIQTVTDASALIDPAEHSILVHKTVEKPVLVNEPAEMASGRVASAAVSAAGNGPTNGTRIISLRTNGQIEACRLQPGLKLLRNADGSLCLVRLPSSIPSTASLLQSAPAAKIAKNIETPTDYSTSVKSLSSISCQQTTTTTADSYIQDLPDLTERTLATPNNSGWWFFFGRQLKKNGLLPVHLRDAKGGLYSRESYSRYKVSSWYCLSRRKHGCKGRVVKSKEGCYAMKEVAHSCPKFNHSRDDLPSIPTLFQRYLDETDETLTAIIKDQGEKKQT